ncbi:MAG: acyl-CoA thioesterase [Deltaproteobacteria bacterium]|nr:acyl-CoA thioesterase [Deltaproteobacteria bacterium]
MSVPGSFTPQIDDDALRLVAKARILFADTDKMGIVYHASYFRYLELARVELIRSVGPPYSALETEGLALPLVEVGVHFSRPGLYDDHISLYCGLSRLSRVRVHFQYRVVVERGDRHGADERVELLQAETRHACVDRVTGKPQRLPQSLFDRMSAVRGA